MLALTRFNSVANLSRELNMAFGLKNWRQLRRVCWLLASLGEAFMRLDRGITAIFYRLFFRMQVTNYTVKTVQKCCIGLVVFKMVGNNQYGLCFEVFTSQDLFYYLVLQNLLKKGWNDCNKIKKNRKYCSLTYTCIFLKYIFKLL